MKEAQDRIKESLLKVIGDVTFIKPHRMKIHTTTPKLTEIFIDEVSRNLPRYQDMELCEIKIIERIGGKDYTDYTFEINPYQIFPKAIHHLPHIVKGFLNKCHYSRKP